jgi:hypothetical protein
MLNRLLAACGGFLLAVLWMDLMFDVQALATPSPETVAAIAGYYRRVTTDAFPMNRLVGGVMMVAIAGSAWDLARARRLRTVLALTAALVPITLAALRTFPNAVRLGTGLDDGTLQQHLATAILRDHVFCFAAITLFTALQIAARSCRP